MTTTTIPQGAQILINEYKEVNDALVYTVRNRNSIGNHSGIMARLLQERLDLLNNNISTYVPHLITREQVMDWIFANAN